MTLVSAVVRRGSQVFFGFLYGKNREELCEKARCFGVVLHGRCWEMKPATRRGGV